jgi:hypothetical protein
MDKEEYKLPILDTLHKAIITISDNSQALFRALLLPSIIMILFSIGQKLIYQHVIALKINSLMMGIYMTFVNIAILFTFGILAAMFAVICHRVVLLGKESLPNSYGIFLTRREWKYFGWVFLFGIPMAIGYMAISMMPPFFMKTMNDPRNILLLFSQVWGIVGLVIVSFITAPFILVLPTTAIGDKRPFNKARSTVRGNIIRVAVVLLIPALITYLVRLAFGYFSPEANSIPYDIVTYIIYLVLLVFETVVLSISYKALSSERLESVSQ